MTMRKNYWTLGAFCAAYCRVVSVDDAIEHQQLFPDLEGADKSLGSVLARLKHEYEGIAKVLGEVDTALARPPEVRGRAAARTNRPARDPNLDELRNFLCRISGFGDIRSSLEHPGHTIESCVQLFKQLALSIDSRFEVRYLISLWQQSGSQLSRGKAQ